MEPDSQEEHVKKLETKLAELREQRIKVDEANEILRKKLQTLTKHLDDLDLKYGKNNPHDEAEVEEGVTDSKPTAVETQVAPEPEKNVVQVPDDQTNETAVDDGSNTEKNP